MEDDFRRQQNDHNRGCMSLKGVGYIQDILEIIKEAAQPGASVSSAIRALRLMTSEPEASKPQRQQETQDQCSYSEQQLSMQVIS